ncbi:MAG: amidase family protein [Chitinophagales bacterium]|nr:amidase family protein [Chitinophagales bacterium]
MNFQDYIQYDALGLAELIRKGEVSASEVLEVAILRAEQINPSLNAIVHTMYGKARERATQALPNHILAGVPFLMKDLELYLAGEPMTHGSQSMKSYIPKEDSYAVKKMKNIGLNIFGKTNTPEFGITPFTEPKANGITKNPWNPAYSAGGSSGGSAAAIAAGVVPMASAGDGGGSIRIPASACGLFGIKPSRGRISLGPGNGEAWSGLVSSFALSRTVRDSAALLDALIGAEPGDPFIFQAPENSFLSEVSRDPQKLRIAYSTQHPFGQSVDADCLDAIQQTVKLLKSLGHEVEEIPLPYEEALLTKTFFMLMADVAADLDILGEMRGREIQKNEVELTTWLLNILGRTYSARDFAYSRKQWNTISRRFGQIHQTYDLWLCPTLAQAPIKNGALQSSAIEEFVLKIAIKAGLVPYFKGTKIIDTIAKRTLGYIPYTPIANMTGQPSMNIPLYWNKDNLPIGVMFTAKMGDEATLFRLAGQLENAQPWKNRRPQL